MTIRKKLLGYTVAFDPKSSSSCRQMARMLASSATRTYFNGDFFIIHNSDQPFFLLQRNGIEEISVEIEDINHQPLADIGNAWKFRSRCVIDPSDYDIVIFLDADCLILQNVDDLFEDDDWDILCQPEPGRAIQDCVFSGYLTDDEMNSLNSDGINAGSWAVRAHLYNAVMETWENIMSCEPVREDYWRDQTAWNRLLLDAESYGWRVKHFPEKSIQFPLHLDLNWHSYKRSSIIHCLGGTNLEKIEFLFGMYMQRFFHDQNGSVVNLLDM